MVRIVCCVAVSCAIVFAQDAATAPSAGFTVEAGTRIPLTMVSSASSKSSNPGDRIYLQTAFPVVISSHIVIPIGSYVTGTVAQVKRPGRVKGKGEISVRFDSITLPNGITRDFRSRLGSVDALSGERVDQKEGEVIADSNKGGDAKTVATGGIAGTSIGAIAGSAAGHPGMGAGIGAGAGAVAGLAGVLLSRGPEAELTRGSTIEMVLDRPLTFASDEVNFGSTPAPRVPDTGAAPARPNSSSPLPVMRRPIP